MAALAKVMQEALALPVDEQVKLASELLANIEVSIEGEPESGADVEVAWAAELDRRADLALRGESKGRDAAEVHERVLASLRARR
jgi:Putative addiction module component